MKNIISCLPLFISLFIVNLNVNSKSNNDKKDNTIKGFLYSNPEYSYYIHNEFNENQNPKKVKQLSDGMPVMLKVNNLKNPLGIDTPVPTFTWIIDHRNRNEYQTGYQILVSSSKAGLDENNGNMWDSKKIISSEQVSILYSGNALESRKKYWWKIRIWDKDGKMSKWSAPAYFEMAFLNPIDWEAMLIGGNYERYRKEFTVNLSKEIIRARAYISAMGLYELRVNGEKVGNSVLNPALADFRKRLWYCTYDVAGNINPGKNAIGISIGGGYVGRVWYTLSDRKFIFQLEIDYADGTSDKIISDGTWKMTGSGPVMTEEKNNIYDGEKYDARNEDDWDLITYNDSSWLSASNATIQPPGNKLLATITPPMKVIETIKPSMKQLFPGIYIFDMGQNISGWAQLKIKGNRGDKVDMRFGEELTFLWNNYSFESDVIIINKSAGLRFRIVDENNYYLWTISDSGKLLMQKKVNGELIQIHEVLKDFITDTAYRIKVEVNGSLISTYVNGVLIEAIMDKTFKSGKVGFAQGPDEKAAFDNVLIKNGNNILFTTNCDNLSVWSDTENVIVNKKGQLVVTNNELIRSVFGNITGGVSQESSAAAGIILSSPSGSGVADQHDIYILKGEGEEVWEPKFTNHGFRYLEVRFNGVLTADNLNGRVVHQAVNKDPEWLGFFECSNTLFNSLYKATQWSVLTNLQFGIPTDCPQRDERHGWTGDAELCSKAALYSFDMPAFYNHWFQNIRDTQRDSTQPGTGYVDNINPRQGEISSSIEEDIPWSSACINIPWDLYMSTGDKEIIRNQYPSMKAFLQWCQDTDNPDYTTDKDCWGDHTSVIQSSVNKRLLATAFYYLSAKRLSIMAGYLGYENDSILYAQLADKIKVAFNHHFLKDNSYYGSGQQTQQALALSFGLCPDSLRNAVTTCLVNDIIERDTLITIGILGAYAIFDALCENGRPDIAFSIANQTSYPSWGYFIKQGATTMWEFWDGKGSRNHPMLGGPLVAYFYERLAGVSPTEPGYKKFIIKPNVTGDIDYVNSTIPTVKGKIVVNWKKESEQKFSMMINVPVNTQAQVFVPTLGNNISSMRIKEGNQILWEKGFPVKKSYDILFNKVDENYIVFQVGSGIYNINANF
jgi:hypothetical protein